MKYVTPLLFFLITSTASVDVAGAQELPPANSAPVVLSEQRTQIWRTFNLNPDCTAAVQSPETGSRNRRYRDLSRRQRPHVTHLNPRKCPQSAGYSSESGKRRFASDCVVGPEGLKPSTIANYHNRI
jgi:hypothetical protein